MLLQDKVIFLTGGSAGIGWHCAKSYAAEGAHVAIFAKEPEAVFRTIDELGSNHLGWPGDLLKSEDVRVALEKTVERFGRLDAIHNNAGVGHPSKPLHETSDEEWDTLFDTNLKSVLYTTRFGLEALKKSRGCILNTSSLVGVIGQALHAAYNATKGGMNTLTKSMAIDYAPDGIRVNAVCPAGVWTPMLRDWTMSQPNPESMEKYLDDIHALGYCPEGDVIADAAVFLLSEKARFITGHIMHVSGGAEIGYRR
jgi:meso-butanediol dehydrogenase/(S,S)-butanediol dehydrogenase/diacetyl reductase